MTLAEAAEIFRYWEHSPPAHLMVQTIARMLGWSRPPTAAGPTRLEEIAGAPPPGLVVARGRELGMPAAVLDPDALRARNRARSLEMARRNQSRG